jgi:hypothetical protein
MKLFNLKFNILIVSLLISFSIKAQSGKNEIIISYKGLLTFSEEEQAKSRSENTYYSSGAELLLQYSISSFLSGSSGLSYQYKSTYNYGGGNYFKYGEIGIPLIISIQNNKNSVNHSFGISLGLYSNMLLHMDWEQQGSSNIQQKDYSEFKEEVNGKDYSFDLYADIKYLQKINSRKFSVSPFLLYRIKQTFFYDYEISRLFIGFKINATLNSNNYEN